MKRTSKLFLLFSIVCVGLVMMSCGGGGGASASGGGGGTPNPPPASSPIVISTTSLPDAVETQPYTAQISASGGGGTLTYQLQSTGAIWAFIDATGKITGTPTYSNNGPQLFRVTVRDSGSQVTYAEFQLTVNLHLQAGSPQFGNASRGVPYSGSTFVMSGVVPYVLTSATGIPPGLTTTLVNGLITVAGTPTTAGEYDLKFVIRDSATTPQSITINQHVSVDSHLHLIHKTYPGTKVGQPFVGQLEIVNGVPPYTVSAPLISTIGLSVDNAGNLSGVLTLDPSGPFYTYGIPFTVSDASGSVDTSYEQFWTYRPLAVLPPRDAIVLHVGDYIGQYFALMGGIFPYSASMQFGQLPPGMQLDTSSFGITGRATTAGVYTFGMHFTDSATPPESADSSYRVEVLGPSIYAPAGDLPKASLNHAYSAPMPLDGGTAPYHWTFLQGELPPGLSLSTTGTVSGKPSAPGRYSFEAKVEDSATPANSVQNFYSILVIDAPSRRNDSIATASVSACCLTATLSPYADPVDIANPDTDYYRYTAKAGGTVSVTTTRDPNSTTDTVIEILDANGRRFQTCKNYEDDQNLAGIVVDATPNAFDDECLNDDAALGHSMQSSLTFLVPSIGPSTVDFYVHVLDFSGRARPDLAYQLSVGGTVPALTLTSSPTQAYFGMGYSTGISINGGGTPPYNFSIVPGSGSMPPGLALPGPSSSSYTYISGTPTAAGHYSFRLQVTDSAATPAVGSATINIDVAEKPRLQFDPLPDATSGQAYDAPYTLTGGTGNQGVGIIGTWPGGLNWINGHVQGTPLEYGTFTGTATPYANYMTGTPVRYTLIVHSGPIVVQGLRAAKLGQVYDAFLTATGGRALNSAQYTWKYLSGTLPPGLTLVGDWVHGIPTAAGTYTFDVQVSDASVPAQSVNATLTVVVQP